MQSIKTLKIEALFHFVYVESILIGLSFMPALLRPMFTSWLHNVTCNLFEVHLGIHPGTGIVPDGWAAYATREEIQDGILQHDVELHQLWPTQPCLSWRCNSIGGTCPPAEQNLLFFHRKHVITQQIIVLSPYNSLYQPKEKMTKRACYLWQRKIK